MNNRNVIFVLLLIVVLQGIHIILDLTSSTSQNSLESQMTQMRELQQMKKRMITVSSADQNMGNNISDQEGNIVDYQSFEGKLNGLENDIKIIHKEIQELNRNLLAASHGFMAISSSFDQKIKMAQKSEEAAEQIPDIMDKKEKPLPPRQQEVVDNVGYFLESTIQEEESWGFSHAQTLEDKLKNASTEARIRVYTKISDAINRKLIVPEKPGFVFLEEFNMFDGVNK